LATLARWCEQVISLVDEKAYHLPQSCFIECGIFARWGEQLLGGVIFLVDEKVVPSLALIVVCGVGIGHLEMCHQPGTLYLRYQHYCLWLSVGIQYFTI
jgi:hypothetical protein